MRCNVTFGKFVTKTWLPHLEETRSPVTARAYGGIVMRLGSPLEPMQVRNVTAEDLGRIIGPLEQEGLSPCTLHNTECAFGSVFRLARQEGVITRSPLDDLKRHGHVYLPFTPYTDEELLRIEDCLPYYPGTNVFGVALHSDLRRHQLLGISGRDLEAHLKDGGVCVSYLVLESSGRLKTSVKVNPHADQAIQIPPKARPYLEKEYAALKKKSCSPDYHNDRGLLFVTRKGEPLTPGALWPSSLAIRNLAGVPSFCLNNLRRTYLLRHGESEVL